MPETSKPEESRTKINLFYNQLFCYNHRKHSKKTSEVIFQRPLNGRKGTSRKSNQYNYDPRKDELKTVRRDQSFGPLQHAETGKSGLSATPDLLNIHTKNTLGEWNQHSGRRGDRALLARTDCVCVLLPFPSCSSIELDQPMEPTGFWGCGSL